MARYQDRFCYGIKRESSFSSIAILKEKTDRSSSVGIQREKSDRIQVNLQREKTTIPEKSIYSIPREQALRGERLNFNFPRERAFQISQQRKPVRFQKLCGWNTPDIQEGVVEWVKIQLLIHGKKDRKLRLNAEELGFRYKPKLRCPGLHDADEFEKESLHPNFFKEKQKEKDQKCVKKTNPIVQKAEEKITSSSVDYKRRLLRSRSKDDMGIITGPKKLEENLDKYCPPKRCKSVICDLNNTWINPGDTSLFKRLLKCAKQYQSNEKEIFDEVDERYEDEGYGSKTSSAEDKLNRDTEFSGWDIPNCDTENDFQCFSLTRKPAKFSYTHQNTSKSQLYGDSEDEGIQTDRTDATSASIKYYKTGYQDNTTDYISKLIERTYSQIGTYKEYGDLLKIRELKSSRVTLRKISIQDAKDVSSGQEQANGSISTNNQKEYYDQQKTLVRSNSSLQSDRTQYPIFCTSPELKFNTSSQRPVSKRIVRSIRDEHTQRLAQTELLNRTRLPYLDFYRAHSSVNLPLSDLLPAVDRSMKNKSGKTKQYVYENVPNITSVAETPRGLEREYTKVNPEENPQTLGGPPFKENSKSLDTGLRRQPSYLAEYYQNPGQWIRNQTTKLAEGNNHGIASIEMSVSGFDVDIKRESDKKKPLGKVRLSGATDKEAKKKLRNAFSRFYNTHSHMRNRDWASEFKYMWNT